MFIFLPFMKKGEDTFALGIFCIEQNYIVSVIKKKKKNTQKILKKKKNSPLEQNM